MKKRNFNHGSPEQLIDALNDRIAELGGDIEACGKVTAAITTATYRDMDGCFVGKGNTITVAELRRMFNEDHDSDPVIGQYEWFQDWLDDSIKNGYLEPVDTACDVKASTDITAADDENPVEERVEEAEAALEEQFDYLVSGLLYLSKRDVNGATDALRIIENAKSVIEELVGQVAAIINP